MKYYRLFDDLHSPENRWFLKSLNVVDENLISVWKFLTPAKVNLPTTKKLKVSIREDGKALDFTFSDFEVLIVNEKVAGILNDDECQLIPVEIEGIKNSQSYFVVVILKSVDCVDESRSTFDKWQSDDLIRPDLAGEYKSIYKLYVDPSRISSNTIFRLGKFDNAIIVNESLKKRFEKNVVSGVRFKGVT